jgi:LacI family transcriptional regulator
MAVTLAPKRIALAIPLGVPYMERIARGVMEYGGPRGWQLMFSPEAVTLSVDTLRSEGLDGVITFATCRQEEGRIAALGIPTVNLSSALTNPRLPRVTVENHSVGRLAAQHLIERGFRNFAYYGVSDVSYGRERGAGFVEAVRSAGFSVSECYALSGLERNRPWLVDLQQLHRWLKQLTLPVGLLAVHDYRARVVLEACSVLGLRVPEDIAVVGTDDDAVACELCSPTLTSVALPGQEIGKRAAELLDRHMANRSHPMAHPMEMSVLVPATKVVARQSTDILAVEDATVAGAVRLVNERITEPLNVAQVANEVCVSRRLLERRFRSALGVTPHEYIARVRVDRAKHLLGVLPALTFKEIAGACGFTDARRLNQTFLTVAGISPQEYRTVQQRGREPAPQNGMLPSQDGR